VSSPELSSEQIKELRQTIRTVDRSSDYRCPDCGGKVSLLAGKFGLFYRCLDGWIQWRKANFDLTVETCSGKFSANSDGTPLGIPGNRATRQARQRIHRLLERHPDLFDWQTLEAELSEKFTEAGRTFGRLSCMSLEDCQLVLRHLEYRPTIWELLSDSSNL